MMAAAAAGTRGVLLAPHRSSPSALLAAASLVDLACDARGDALNGVGGSSSGGGSSGSLGTSATAAADQIANGRAATPDGGGSSRSHLHNAASIKGTDSSTQNGTSSGNSFGSAVAGVPQWSAHAEGLPGQSSGADGATPATRVGKAHTAESRAKISASNKVSVFFCLVLAASDAL
jgi:hypothetical protein